MLIGILFFILMILLLYFYYRNQCSKKEGWGAVGRWVRRAARSVSRAVSRVAEDAARKARELAEAAAREARRIAEEAARLARKAWEEAQRIAKMIADQFNKLKEIYEKIKKFVMNIINKLDPTPLFEMAAKIGKGIVNLVNQLGQQMKKIKEVFEDIGNGIKDGANYIFDKLKDIFKELAKIKDVVNEIPGQLKIIERFFVNIANDFVGAMKEIPKPFIAFGELMERQFNEIGRFFERLWGSITDLPYKIAGDIGLIK